MIQPGSISRELRIHKLHFRIFLAHLFSIYKSARRWILGNMLSCCDLFLFRSEACRMMFLQLLIVQIITKKTPINAFAVTLFTLIDNFPVKMSNSEWSCDGWIYHQLLSLTMWASSSGILISNDSVFWGPNHIEHKCLLLKATMNSIYKYLHLLSLKGGLAEFFVIVVSLRRNHLDLVSRTIDRNQINIFISCFIEKKPFVSSFQNQRSEPKKHFCYNDDDETDIIKLLKNWKNLRWPNKKAQSKRSKILYNIIRM